MESRDWSKWLITRLSGSAACTALLLGTIAFAQNPVTAPPSPPGNPSDTPPARLVWFAQPKAVDDQAPAKQPAPAQEPAKQPAPGKAGIPAKQPAPVIQPLPGKQPVAGKDAGPKIETLPLPRALPAPMLEVGEEGLVISLPAALRLANAEAWDIKIAEKQLQIAASQLLGADVLWLPTLTAGVDYQYHSGPIQSTDGTTSNNTHDNLYAGGSPLAIFAITDAIFTPLAQRQVVRAQGANIQTARNDTLTDLAVVYFDLLEAEADLASIMDVDNRANALVIKCELLAPGLIPTVELARTKAIKANIEQVVETARQRWRNSSAEVARIARLKPTVVLQPLEPPHMRIKLVPDTLTPDELIPIALARRPELTFYEAQAAAARERARQEKWRPFLPTLIARGGGTTPPYPMAFGAYGSGSGTGLSNFTERSDWDVSAVWTLQNMGLGNLALIRERRHEFDLAKITEYRFRDVVAREVTVAWSDIRSADRRVAQVARELREAEISAKQNLEGLGEVKRAAGNINILVIRPQEVVQSLQALNQAYFNYYSVVAEYNRAQFRMYRALGNPAQMLDGRDGQPGAQLNNAKK